MMKLLGQPNSCHLLSCVFVFQFCDVVEFAIIRPYDHYATFGYQE